MEVSNPHIIITQKKVLSCRGIRRFALYVANICWSGGQEKRGVSFPKRITLHFMIFHDILRLGAGPHSCSSHMQDRVQTNDRRASSKLNKIQVGGPVQASATVFTGKVGCHASFNSCVI